MPTLPVTRPQAVRLLGVADRTFARLESEGILTATTPGTGRRASVYNAYALVGAYLAHRERQLTGRTESARDRRDSAQAQLTELRVARERRELLPRETVVREGQAFVAAIAAKLRALPSRLRRAGAIAPAVEPVVTELLHGAQDEVARWRTHLDLLAAIDDEARA